MLKLLNLLPFLLFFIALIETNYIHLFYSEIAWLSLITSIILRFLIKDKIFQNIFLVLFCSFFIFNYFLRNYYSVSLSFDNGEICISSTCIEKDPSLTLRTHFTLYELPTVCNLYTKINEEEAEELCSVNIMNRNLTYTNYSLEDERFDIVYLDFYRKISNVKVNHKIEEDILEIHQEMLNTFYFICILVIGYLFYRIRHR